MNRKWLRLCGLLVLLAGSTALVACGVSRERSVKPPADWSRGVKLGVSSVNNPVGFDVSEDGELLLMAWAIRENDTDGLHYVALNGRGEATADVTLPISSNKPNRVKIYSDGIGGAHLFWIDRQLETRALLHARLTPEGRLATPPAVLSLPNAGVDDYAAGVGPDGYVEIFWTAEAEGRKDIFHDRLDSAGRRVLDSMLLVPGGQSPNLAIDREGQIHLVWEVPQSHDRRYVHYAVFEATHRQLTHHAELGSYVTGTGLVGHSPVIGLAADQAYVFWSVERRGGGSSMPSAESYYVSVSLAGDETSSPSRLIIPDEAKPRFLPAQGDLPYSLLVPPPADTQAASSDSRFVYMASPVPGHRDELGVLFTTELSTRNSSHLQTILTIWAGGQMNGYQIVGKTTSTSLRPQALLAPAGGLHAVWIDTAGFGQYDVYYATTDAEGKANLNRFTWGDLLSASLNTAWTIASSLSFFPVIIFWAFIPFVWVIGYYFFTVEGDLRRSGPKIALAVAAVLYVVAKFFVLPAGFLDYVPFLDVVPEHLVGVLMFGIPLLVLALAVLASVLYARRSESKSLLVAYVIFCAVDGLVSFAIYVPTLTEV